MSKLSEKAREMITGTSFAYLATLMPDGSPHVSPVWVDLEDGHILVNSAEGRVKVENVRRDPRVALSIADLDNPYYHLDVRGRVVELVEGEPAVEHIDKLERMYRGNERYPLRPGMRRVILRVEPLAVYEGR